MGQIKRNMYKKIQTTLCIILVSIIFLFPLSSTYSQQNNFVNDSISFIQIKTDSLFNSRQIINLLTLPKSSFNKYRIKFVCSDPDLNTTSWFGETENALASVNGSFFDVDSGGSVTYVEINDSIIGRTRSSDLKWAKPDSLIDGAVIETKDYNIKIQPVKSDDFYEKSKQEAAVMVAGPLLLLDSKKVKLPQMEFATKRHPRTCLCTNKDSVMFIVIDGRRKDAEGMNLYEAQEFLQDLGCVDAINLDGGGSSTMWIKDKGVVNSPSDSTGERPVSNVLLIINENQE